jgi:hypothetical protein
MMSMREGQLIWVGDDWAEDHHDIELLDDHGRRLARARLPEGLDGIGRLHALIAEHMPASWADLEPAEAARRVQIGIETDRGNLGAGALTTFASLTYATLIDATPTPEQVAEAVASQAG